MVKVLVGDLFDSKAQTLVNTVNCVGVMGKGVALEFKKRFPEMFEDYEQRCRRREVKLGRPYLFKRLVPPWILNFPTKDHWRSVANLDAIVEGLRHLLQHYKEWEITSLAVPPLGCGQGQLEWRVVGPTLYRYLSKMDIPVELYAPYGTPHEELRLEFLQGDTTAKENGSAMPEPQWIKPAWVALVEILQRLEEQPYHPAVGRTTFQKIAYVATQEGLPTDLHHQRGSYGPYSEELKGLTARLINNGLIREEKLGRMLGIKVGPTFKDARKAYETDLKQWETIIEKTADLFMRLDTKQAEVVATVLFTAQALQEREKTRPSESDVLKAVMDWKQRRRPPLEEPEVALTVRNLAALKWLRVTPSSNLPLTDETGLDI
jgi:O-acetyl-ADP-ribose deacetylase (regulator of RNase III)/uncharacterized protein YwgA